MIKENCETSSQAKALAILEPPVMDAIWQKGRQGKD
jgi:hypothetical protein